MANKNNTVIYVGVTSDLLKRVYQHKTKTYKGFTYKYNCNKLVSFEEFDDINQAIAREKQIKNWKKDWKLNLIKELNPNLETLKI